jgi:hypothetical protein
MLFIIFIVLLFFCLIGTKVIRNGYNVDYLSISQCNVVKGFFILLVFISHINQYILKTGYVASSIGDVLYFKIPGYIGQLMVVMFLFFSGYGVMESYKKKGRDYVSSMPQNRILVTLLNFDVAVLVYIALNLFLRKPMTFSQILLSFIAWDSVGNSNWYIFCILLCYIISFLYFLLIVRQQKDHGYEFFWILFISFLFVMYFLSFFKGSWWYNTILCFPLGMLYSKMKMKINVLIQNNFYLSFSILVAFFCVFRNIPISGSGLFYNLGSMSFAMMVVLLMMKLELNNKYLIWIGKKLFPLYIYQRLMMILIYEIPGGRDFIVSYPCLYIMICFLSVLLIALTYPKWQVTFKK